MIVGAPRAAALPLAPTRQEVWLSEGPGTTFLTSLPTTPAEQAGWRVDVLVRVDAAGLRPMGSTSAGSSRASDHYGYAAPRIRSGGHGRARIVRPGAGQTNDLPSMRCRCMDFLMTSNIPPTSDPDVGGGLIGAG
jgi:hypothetical protein